MENIFLLGLFIFILGMGIRYGDKSIEKINDII